MPASYFSFSLQHFFLFYVDIIEKNMFQIQRNLMEGEIEWPFNMLLI